MPSHNPRQKAPRRFRLQEHLGLLFTVLVLASGLAIAYAGYRMTARTAISAVNHLADSVSRTVASETTNSVRLPVQAFVSLLVQGELPAAQNLQERLAVLPALQDILNVYPIVEAAYAGYADGGFFLVRPLRTPSALASFDAPADTALLVQSNDPAGNTFRAEYLFYDRDLRLLERRPQTYTGFDPRNRPWYREAAQERRLISGAPYVFFTTQEIGTTFAQNAGGGAVVGADIGLSRLSKVLAAELPSKGAQIVLFRPDGSLVAAADGMLVQDGRTLRLRVPGEFPDVVRLGMQAYREGRRGRFPQADAVGRGWELSVQEFSFSDAAKNVLLLAVPRDEILADAMLFVRWTALITLGVLLFSIPVIWLAARAIARPLGALADKARRIEEFHLDEVEENIHSGVTEIHTLSQGMHRMQDNIKKFLSITGAISAERDFHLLLERVLRETLDVAAADGGMVALLDEERNCFKEGSACWLERSNGRMAQCRMLDCAEPDITLPPYQALQADDFVRTAITREDRRSTVDFLAPGFGDPDIVQVDVLCLPLRDRMGQNLGVLALFKAMAPGSNSFQDAQVAFIKALAGTAAIALENQSLLKAQRDLRDALVHILAGAIDAKSPYTGGHCQRVPIIFQMLAKAACDVTEGPLKDYTLTPDNWEEARLAAWLHDCGKVTTPEYVVDKATKLETICDRIHEVRTRFEVLKRDAEIASLQAVADGADAEAEERKLEESLRALDDDFAFVAGCNIGGEFMDDAALERLEAIGKRSWLRTLDNRLGVSRDELARMEHAPAEPLPAREPLLRDAPEHIIKRGEKDKMPPDNPWGFKMDVPEALYNRGELHNLRIRRGTLNDEERYKINDHIIQTIIMLKKLPLPRQLRDIPEIAGAHHETMDGKGYPRRLFREDMGWSARMMAIADIFEALTASDRPYKPGKTLSEALKIMKEFHDRHHIDPDLYALFLKADIPHQYAAEHLRPEQIDV